MARFRSLGSIHSLTVPVGFCTTTSELTHSVGASWALLLSAFPSFLVPRQLLLSVARVPSLEHGLQAQLLLLALCDTYRANILIQWTILDSPRAALASMVALDLLTDNSFQQTKLKIRVSNKHRSTSVSTTKNLTFSTWSLYLVVNATSPLGFSLCRKRKQYSSGLSQGR